MNWPSPGNDPWYAANPTQSLERRNYYAVNATPTFKVDGATASISSSSISNLYNQRRAVNSPVWFDLSARMTTGDSLVLTVRAVAESPISGNYRLKTYLLEVHEQWSPAAPNGQTSFDYPFVMAAPSVAGVPFTHSGSTSDTLIFESRFPPRTTGQQPYTVDNCGFIVYLQNETAVGTTKEIVQAKFLRMPLDFPSLSIATTAAVDLNGNLDGRIDDGENGRITASITNGTYFAPAANARAILRTTVPGIIITDSTSTFGLVNPGATISNDADPFQIAVTAGTPVQWATFTLVMLADGDYVNSSTFRVRIGRPDLLLVQADSSFDFSSQYTTALTSSLIDYDLWDKDVSPLDEVEMNRYPNVIWFTGMRSTNVLTVVDRTMIGDYIDDGKNFMLSSQNALEYLMSVDSVWAQTYLKANLVMSRLTNYTMNGIVGDPFFGNLTVRTAGAGGAGNCDNATVMTPRAGATGILMYNGRADFAGVYYYTPSTSGHVLFLGIPFEAISGAQSTMTRELFIQRAMLFLNSTNDAPESPTELPTSVRLSEAYPNPFNPTSTVKLSLPRTSVVNAVVYDLAGRETKSITRAPFAAGEHTIAVDLNNQPSGIYFLHVEVNGVTNIRKLVLMK
ncbi:MAG: T9SS type A sorting domain-containing protein [bacterium]|nr:T9SS type A sorting domain-containing protein [bacterium]